MRNLQPVTQAARKAKTQAQVPNSVSWGQPSEALMDLPIFSLPMFRHGQSSLNIRLHPTNLCGLDTTTGIETADCLVHLPGVLNPARIRLHFDAATNTYTFREPTLAAKSFTEDEVLAAVERAYVPGIPSLGSFFSELDKILPVFAEYEHTVCADFEVDAAGDLQLQLCTESFLGPVIVSASHRPLGGYLYLVDAPGSILDELIAEAGILDDPEPLHNKDFQDFCALLGVELESSKDAAEALVRLLAFLSLHSSQPRMADPYQPSFAGDFHDDRSFERVYYVPGTIGRHGG